MTKAITEQTPKITRDEIEKRMAKAERRLAHHKELLEYDNAELRQGAKTFIKHNEEEIALCTLALQALAMQPRPNASVFVMQSTAGPDYYVQFDCGGRTTTPYRFKERYKAEYHVAHFNWIFHGGDEPQLMDYNPESWPGIPIPSLPEPRT